MTLIRRLATVALLFAAFPLLHAQTPSSTSQAKAQAQAAAATDKIDINTASPDQLKSIPGIGDAYAKRIVDGRPYAQKTQLLSRGILPQATYDKVKERIVASRVAAKK